MAQRIKLLICVFYVAVAYNFQESSAQGTNLLQNYLRQYFKEYSPNTVRSYTLYGNGQNGVADFQAGLPYPMEKTGRVNNLVYTPMGNPLPNPSSPGSNQRGASAKSSQPQQWVNPINSFNPYSVDPSQIKVPLPDSVIQYVSSSRSDLQTDDKDGELGQDFGEIAIQASLAF